MGAVEPPLLSAANNLGNKIAADGNCFQTPREIVLTGFRHNHGGFDERDG
jgi:hypothetical protein